jgi:hypothetical protein
MKRINIYCSLLMISALAVSCDTGGSKKANDVLSEKSITLPVNVLKDKIRGGWAGQTIGVVYGAPVEFKYQGSTVQDDQPIPWNRGYMKYWWDKKPGLFDDIYNDLTFVEIFETSGLDVSADTIARHFAASDYHLAHANQQARYNIRQGLMPPLSGSWMNNPHADDIDFQIESDFIGLMTPGMVNTATGVADRVGHIMNSGDGWYGGVFTSSLYSLAFVSSDVNYVVSEACSCIPAGTKFHDCIADVIKWHLQYPDDWHKCWFELHKKWNYDVGCPKGVFLSFNIDAKLNAAYVALALLYGNGDFTKSVDIAARCGQDSDCNPSTVGGVLGVMRGYSSIPSFWRDPLADIESLNFQGTDISLEKANQLSYKHAIQWIKREGGAVSENQVTIPLSKPVPVAFEQNFGKTFPVSREKVDLSFSGSYSFSFSGNGFVLFGNLIKNSSVSRDYLDRVLNKFGSEVFALAEPEDPYVAKLQLFIDGRLDQNVTMPVKNSSRRLEPAWKYLLPEGKHSVVLKWLNPDQHYEIRINDLVVYSENKPQSNLPQ